jgi:glucose/mannose-6-phosphate isomerase
VTPTPYPDSLGIWDATAALPEQLGSALVAATEVLDDTVLPGPGQIQSVVVFGMGTGATAAEAVAAYGAGRSTVPIVAANGFESPAFVGPHTVAFAVSPSGNTEETYAAATAAAARGAHVVIVSGDGALAQLATASGFSHFAIPKNLPAPRTALGALTVPVLLTLARLGLIPDVAPSLGHTVASLRGRRDAFVAPAGPAAEVARIIGRTIPLIYGSAGLSAVAARRWKTQLNENAKTPAFFAVQPELSHNEVAGWGQNGDVTRQVFSLVTLRQDNEHPQVARRFSLVVEATDEVMANVIPVWAQGDDDLGRFFDHALFGDFVSLHMAGREGTDPGPVPAITDMEAALLR